MLPRVPIAVLALALIGAAVAGPAAGERSAHSARTVQVAVKDDFYSPSSLTVSAGTRVRWVWKGHHPHNVTVTSGPVDFASSTKRKGDFARTLRKAGTYRIICTIHTQRMKLVVRKPR
jgi:plastocyanin